MTRRPTPAELGLEVTIAIVALTAPYEHFICVTDQMISHDNELPAVDSALIKNIGFCRNWSVAFAANNIENALPLLERARRKLVKPGEPIDAEELKSAFATAIFDSLQEDFFNRRLGRYGYKSVEQFRQEGKADLGDHYFEMCRELDKANVGVDFIVYGYDTGRATQLFQVDGQGGISDRMAFRYAVAGSGYTIASALLKQKPLAIDFDSMLYRLLEAKFFAETASGVGEKTTVMFKRRDTHDWVMGPQEIQKIRDIWKAKMREPEPEAARIISGNIQMAMMRDAEMWAKRAESTGSGS